MGVGKVTIAKAFDTYTTSLALDEFIDGFIGENNGHIIAIACKDDCISSLSEYCKTWLR